MGFIEAFFMGVATRVGAAKLNSRDADDVAKIGAKTASRLSYLGVIFPGLEQRAARFSKPMIQLAKQNKKPKR